MTCASHPNAYLERIHFLDFGECLAVAGGRVSESDKADFDNRREIIDICGRLAKYFLFLTESTGRRA